MFAFESIGVIRSCFREKFGVPRQPGLAPAAPATLELRPPYAQPTIVRGLKDFSHLWLLFVFHGVPTGRWQPTVRPPRLGGHRRLGVFATRSTFRPNPLGLSVVRLEHITIGPNRIMLHLAGVDLLDGTPVLDIKPYLPYADRISEATGGFAPEAPTTELAVEFSPQAAAFCTNWLYGDLRELITQILRQDPRPAYDRGKAISRQYGMKLYDFDLKFRIGDETVYVIEISPLTQ
ncbi:MAG: tRNA (N6-threonylcarbamoyladenosine(37)-N6)-methyltransferase TrmO [Gammaproteobacteria bacterium]|nr:tRNA (N6-threonylcarbamoyladenosine(37)-N6)-methyltransferase TrmO [Gammaproteobacteria bacterium]MCP5196417.1 tRNA (N6-threonylcarbamoyladenosine(37)-N6)-methyltransferase TrmO [Gammaproteobacteria bacterium]